MMTSRHDNTPSAISRARFRAPHVWFLFALAPATLPACGDEFSSCEARKKCSSGGAGGGINQSGGTASGGAANAGEAGDTFAGRTSAGSSATGGTSQGGTGPDQAGAGGDVDDTSSTGGKTPGAAGSGGLSFGSGGTSANGGASNGAGGTNGTSGSPGDGTAIANLNQPCATEGDAACRGHAQKQQLLCSGSKWIANGTCTGNSNCDTTPGLNAGSCQPIVAACGSQPAGSTVCSADGKSVQRCGLDLVTTTLVTACSGETPACLKGSCVACTPGATKCSGNSVQTCNAQGAWEAPTDCPAATPVCDGNVCAPPPSCAGLAADCGATGSDSCCTSPVVPGGTFNRSNDPSYPATVSTFRLDAYEVTVGRFKKFAGAYSQTVIRAGAGTNPNNASDPGWSTAWNAELPTDATALATSLQQCDPVSTWSSGNARLPINCVSWALAEAFCIWDGGRLPTEAEWNYAAAGGPEQRDYPWGDTPPGNDTALAIYGCNYPTPGGTCVSYANIAPVGTPSAGKAKWGQLDMAGNVWEWTQDSFGDPYPVPCVNCATRSNGISATYRGGAFGLATPHLLTAKRPELASNYLLSGSGVRCARAR